MDDLCKPFDPGRNRVPGSLRALYGHADGIETNPGLCAARRLSDLRDQLCDAHRWRRYACCYIPA